jgi:hypothetical protein
MFQSQLTNRAPDGQIGFESYRYLRNGMLLDWAKYHIMSLRLGPLTFAVIFDPI